MWRSALISTLAISLLGGANWSEAWNWWRGQDAFHEEQYLTAAENFAQGLTGEAGATQSKLAYNEGIADYRAEDWATAEGALSRAAEADPQNWRALYNKGNAQVQQGYVDGTVTDRAKLEAAVASYEATLKIQPDDADTIHNLEYVKKLLEEDKQQQQKPQDQKDQEKQDKSQNKDQEQDQKNDSSDDGKNEDKDSDSNEGDKEKDAESKPGDKDEQQKDKGDQEQQLQNQGGQQEEQQEQQRPDLRYSQEILDKLAQQEAAIQYNRALARDRADGDPFQNLLNQLLDPNGTMFGEPNERRRSSSDGVDW